MSAPRFRPAVLRVLAPIGAALALCVAAAPAAAGSFGCDASAVRISITGGPAIEPVTANHGATTCQNANNSLGAIPSGLPVPLGASVLDATTFTSGSSGPSQSVQSTASIAKLDVGALPSLPIQVPIPPGFGAISVPTGLPSPLDTITVDLRPALQALLPNGGLPTASLLHLAAASSSATGVCLGSNAQLTGTSQAAGLSVFGQPLPTDTATTQGINAIGGGAINPGQIDPTLIPLPPAISGLLPAQVAAVQATIKTFLGTLPAIPIPATIAQVIVTPNIQSILNGRLLRQALRVQVSIGGQSILDFVAAESAVSGAGQPCGASSTTTQAQLQCTTRKLVLVDVVPEGNHVRLFGAADKRFVGRRVSIVFRATGRVVARPKVAADGSFRATAPLPPASVRDTNRARYQARIGSERSLDLKLARRLRVSGLSSAGGRVTIAGRVVRPLATPVRTIVVKRRITCRTWRVVKRIRPASDGSFRVTVAAPPTGSSAVYRLSTFVRKNRSNPKAFPTFTLPRAVALLR